MLLEATPHTSQQVCNQSVVAGKCAGHNVTIHDDIAEGALRQAQPLQQAVPWVAQAAGCCWQRLQSCWPVLHLGRRSTAADAGVLLRCWCFCSALRLQAPGWHNEALFCVKPGCRLQITRELLYSCMGTQPSRQHAVQWCKVKSQGEAEGSLSLLQPPDNVWQAGRQLTSALAATLQAPPSQKTAGAPKV